MASLQHEAKEVEDSFQRKLLEVEADAAAIEKVGPHLPCLVSFPVDFGLDFTLELLPFLLQTAQEAQRVHDKAGRAGAAVQKTLSALEELLRLMSRFCYVLVGCGWRQVPSGV